MSLIRLLLIPLIVYLYCYAEKHIAAVLLVLLSGITDIADGIIARKFNMVSDLGKILDPIADKLTQGVLIICLAVKYPLMLGLVALFVIKELGMLIMGYMTIRKFGAVNSSRWHGKLATVLLYAAMTLLILWPTMPVYAVNRLICLCGVVMLFSLAMYFHFYLTLWRSNTGP